MISMTLGEIATIVGGRLINADEGKVTSAYPVIDSRRATAGTFFVAFKGENSDGHSFIESALSNGAEFAIATEECAQPAIIVSDALQALTILAKHVRDSLSGLIVIGITGSQGKTTTKDLLRHILSTQGEVVAPEASLNNELGVPLLILRCTESTKYCVVEMGARHQGDIAYLSEIAKPSIGLILSIGKAHLGEFGSREIIAKTKAELILALPDSGVAVLGTYDELTPHMADDLPLAKVLFGEKSNCDVRAADIEVRDGRAHFDLVTTEGRAPISLQLLGLHQISNALGAAAVATVLKIPLEAIAASLSTAESASKWRMEIIEKDEIVFLNDSYNANPESMAAALRTLALISQERGGRSWAFLGKMHELGSTSEAEHQEIGRLATEIGIDHLVSVGTEDYLSGISESELEEGETQLHFFPSRIEASSISEHFSKGDVILIKASRAEELNLLADDLIAAWEGSEQ